ncbi:hypothetical protein ABTW24_06230 [Sphingobacterium thalpophilum]|uniref:Late embryogenesis abundant protein n=1 Tax=Sphingobacterium thalpophilum TaxID=259 RepID=A0ABV4HAX2_9SPHI|nr:hypothetical protein [Sphingobacterium sp. InxBP1]MCW8311677.1 hypothetical protein [Sphingobacterium sp. InxBP1]
MSKKILFGYLLLLSLFVSACGVNRQKAQIENLAKCKFDVESVDSIRLAGTSLDRLIKNNEIDLGAAPGLALAYLRKDIPLDAVIRLKIDNPTLKKASINKFQYIILYGKQQLVEGIVNQPLQIDPGASTVANVRIATNIYDLLMNSDLKDFLMSSDQNKKGIFTLKIKPSINIAGQSIFYPGYITIDKTVSRKILL